MSLEPALEHIPVLLEETINFWVHSPKGIYVDLTTGAGGHSHALLSRFPEATCLCVDWNEKSLLLARERLKDFGPRVTFVQSNFRRLKKIVSEHALGGVDGVLFDLGPSTFQILKSGLGLSYQVDEPFDMRLESANKGLTASEILKSLSAKELEDLLVQQGELSMGLSRRISRAIKNFNGGIETSIKFVEILKSVTNNRKIWAQVFQSLRLAVNDELGAIEEMLETLPQVLKTDARAVSISFHSLEDRLVKERFRSWVKNGQFLSLTKSVIWATPEELRHNPKARSARLRAVQKI